MVAERGRFYLAVLLGSTLLFLYFAHTLLAPVFAGVILAAGLRPLYARFPFSLVPSYAWRRRVFVSFVLILGATLMSYVLVAGARLLVRNAISLEPVPSTLNRSAPAGIAEHLFPPRIIEPAGDFVPTPISGFVEHIKVLLQSIPGMDAASVARTWDDLLGKGRELALRIVSIIIADLPALLMQCVVFILTFIFVSLSYEQIFSVFERVDPRLLPGASSLAKIFEEATQSTLLGSIVAGFCQATVVSTGMALAGFGNFFLLGICAFLASFVPFIGVGLVWGSALVYSLSLGHNEAAVVVIITGCISSLVDNFLIPTFVGSSSHVHPLVLFVVILGAVDVLGVWGLFIGPVTAIFSIQVAQRWLNEQINPGTPLPKKVDPGINGHRILEE